VSAIVVENASKHWTTGEGQVRAVDGISFELEPGTLNVLLRYDWPGNVRELENVIERAVVLARGPNLTTDELPPVLSGPEPAGPRPGGLIPGATFREIEREAILRTLEVVDGSTTRAAEMLGISTRKIQYRLKAYARQDREAARDEQPGGSSGRPPRET